MSPAETRRELVSWEDIDQLIDHLIPQFRREFTAMVMITRGGIVPGGIAGPSHGCNACADRGGQLPGADRPEKDKLMAWPEFLQFPADDLLRGRPHADRG